MNILKKWMEYKENENIIIRYNTQITVILHSDSISRLLKDLACNNISIDGFLYIYNNCEQSIFKFVPLNNNEQTSQQINSVLHILDNNKFGYNKKDIVKISFKRTPVGTLEDIYTTISKYIQIKSMYLNENNSIFIESEHPKKLREILLAYYNIKKLI